MGSFEQKQASYAERLTGARTRLLCTHGFYGLLLMHMSFALNPAIETAQTDGEKTYFSPAFLERLNDAELEFVLLHEILHVVLQHCARYGARNRFLFNLACDIVVNSNILYENNMDERSISIRGYGVSIHKAPNGEEGYLYTAEEVYEMLLEKGDSNAHKQGWDNHEAWGKFPLNSPIVDAWKNHFENACLCMENRGGIDAGNIPLFAKRLLHDLKKSQIDWRLILNEFIQFDVNDYSLVPPDKRFADSPFLLPDYNDTQECIKNILFMVDASGSVSDSELTYAFSEIKGALEQFNGALSGKVAFFDCVVQEPIWEFDDIHSLLKIKPSGGGGTSFHAIFKYIKSKMEQLPEAIVILTDGRAIFPKEEEVLDLPVLWLINNEKVTPPWGKVARIKVDKRR